MKKIFYVFFFLSFANIMLGQVGIRVEGTQFAKKNQLDWEKRNEINTVIITQKPPTRLPTDLKKYFLSKNVMGNSSNIFNKKNADHESAFFCKIEVELENSSNLPIRFRLGEVQAVDQKEGKWKQFQ